MIWKFKITALLLFFYFFFLSIPVSAQILPGTDAKEAVTPELEWPADSLDRRNPRGTVSGFIKAIADQNYVKASAFLDLDEIPKAEQAELARKLKILLDQSGEILPYSWISDDATGDINDKLAPSYDKVGELSVDGEEIDLIVEEIKGPEGGPLWLFSSETLKEIAKIKEVQETVLLIDQILPEYLEEKLWRGIPVGHWLFLLLSIVCSYLVAWFLVFLLFFIIKKLWRKARTEPTEGILQALKLPLKLFLASILFVASSQELGISIIVRQRFSELTLIVSLLAFLILLWRLNDFISKFTEKRMTLRGQFSAVSVILFLRRLAKIAIIIIGIISILSSFGFDVTAGLAALGIGGIALALGAQKSMENFVGSVTLIADRPIRVGDYCKIGTTSGTVEEIGMRSTRIRTLDRTIVTIPNGELSSTRIENYAPRDQFRFTTIFNFRYETTEDQLRFLLVELRKILYAHPKVFPEPARVRFIEFGSASLNVEIFAYLNAVSYEDFLEIREDLLLRMMEKVESSGTGFAFPSQTLYFAKDKGNSETKTKIAEEKVKEWKEHRDLNLPKFPQEEIEKLKDTIAYPPENSKMKKEEETKKQG